MAWYFADPSSPGPTSWEVYGLDGEHPCTWITVQAYQIILMYPQDMRKGWQYIHGHRYIISEPTPPWEWFGGLQILQNLGP